MRIIVDQMDIVLGIEVKTDGAREKWAGSREDWGNDKIEW